MKIIMYAVALLLAGWLVLAVKELKQYLAANWNNLTVAGMPDKESFIAEQEQVHAKLFVGKKRHLTYSRKMFFRKFKWVLGDALVAGILYSAGLEPDDYVGICNLLTVTYVMISFLVYGDFYFTFSLLDRVHKREDYGVEKLAEFYDARQYLEERLMPEYVLLGFRVLRFVVILAAIGALLYTA